MLQWFSQFLWISWIQWKSALFRENPNAQQLDRVHSWVLFRKGSFSWNVCLLHVSKEYSLKPISRSNKRSTTDPKWGKCTGYWWLEELPKRFSEDLKHEILSQFWDIFFVTFLKCIKVTHKCFRRGLKRGRLNRTSETRKLQFCWRGYFAHVSITYAIVSHLGCQPLLKITKMAAISLNLMIGTCNKNWIPLSLG